MWKWLKTRLWGFYRHFYGHSWSSRLAPSFPAKPKRTFSRQYTFRPHAHKHPADRSEGLPEVERLCRGRGRRFCLPDVALPTAFSSRAGSIVYLVCLVCTLFVAVKTPRKPAPLLGLAKSKYDKKGVRYDKKGVEYDKKGVPSTGKVTKTRSAKGDKKGAKYDKKGVGHRWQKWMKYDKKGV